MARQFNLIPPICEQAEYHMFQREKVEVQLPELFHKIGGFPASPRPRPAPLLSIAPPLPSPAPILSRFPACLPSPYRFRPGPAPLMPCCCGARSPLPRPFPFSLLLLGALGLTSPRSPLPGVGAMTWSPLACGIVSGKYDSGIPPYSRASLKVKQRRGPGGGDRQGQAFWKDGSFGAGHLPWATVCGAVPGVGTWIPQLA